MKLSQTSKTGPDPLSDVLEVLGARVTRRTRLEAAGDWALSFPGLDRLKFVALLRGTCWLGIPGRAPDPMQAGDICLIGATPYAVSSDPVLSPQDGGRLYEDPGRDLVRLGGDDVILVGGTVSFAGMPADFLLDMLPDVMAVPRHSPGAGAIATILSLISAERERSAIGTEIVGARLADILLVEAFRAYGAQVEPAEGGWIGALVDPRIGRSLQALHGDVARAWTVADLAAIAGMSRAAFSASFALRVGHPPLSYLRAWRLTRARRALARDGARVADVALAVGYQSQSAFSQAFLRHFGTSPKSDRRGNTGLSGGAAARGTTGSAPRG